MIEASGLTKSFTIGRRKVAALDGIDLHVPSGEAVSIVGPSGCGKTTLLRVLAGLEHPGTGHLVRPENRRIGVAFQEPRLMPWLTVEANLALGLRRLDLDSDTRRQKIADTLTGVGLAGFAQAYPAQLSGGMAQRAALARALVRQPGLFLLDEPFSALDALTRRALQADLIRLLAALRATLVLVTHDVAEAVLFADRVLVMRAGRFVAEIPVKLSRPRNPTDSAFGLLTARVFGALDSQPPLAA